MTEEDTSQTHAKADHGGGGGGASGEEGAGPPPRTNAALRTHLGTPLYRCAHLHTSARQCTRAKHLPRASIYQLVIR